jgi:hypothetical protein
MLIVMEGTGPFAAANVSGNITEIPHLTMVFDDMF